MIDQDVCDTAPKRLQDSTCNHCVPSEREHIVKHGAVTVWPALDGVSGSESVDDLHEAPLTRPCQADTQEKSLSAADPKAPRAWAPWTRSSRIARL